MGDTICACCELEIPEDSFYAEVAVTFRHGGAMVEQAAETYVCLHCFASKLLAGIFKEKP